MTRRRNNNNRGVGARNIHNELRQLRREMNGYAPKRGPIDPPPVTERPYYPLCVRFDLLGPGEEFVLEVATLVKRATSQLGLTAQASANMVVKLHKIEGWAYQYGPGEDRVAINGEISGLVPNVSDLLTQATVNPSITYPVQYKYIDFGSLNKPAHFAYVWPKSQQQIALNLTSNFVIGTAASNTKNGTLHVHITWSTSGVQVAAD